jgi:hypothetical protein
MRRCTVWSSQTWHDPTYTHNRPKYNGWLLHIEPKDGYNGKCIVVTDQGRMLREDMADVQVHIPPSIPLLHGAPRRGEHGDGLPADET